MDWRNWRQSLQTHQTNLSYPSIFQFNVIFWVFPGKQWRWLDAWLYQVTVYPETSIYQPTIPHLAFVIQKSYPSIEAFALFLGAVWLCVDLRSAETFELSAIMFFTWFYVTHVSILTSDFSKTFSKISSSKYRTFCYQSTVWRDWWIKLLCILKLQTHQSIDFVVSVNDFSPDSSSALLS
jgi:hypothetical protein